MSRGLGDVYKRQVDMEGMGQRIFDYFLKIASGEKTKSEKLNLGRHEFIPWNIGITG